MSKRYYTEDHEWVEVDGDIATVGVTDHAQEQLGDIVLVDLPAVDAALERGATAGAIESVKAANDIFAPLTGAVTEVNEALSAAPDTVNKAAESDGWFFRMRLSNPAELDDLMDADAYKAHIG